MSTHLSSHTDAFVIVNPVGFWDILRRTNNGVSAEPTLDVGPRDDTVQLQRVVPATRQHVLGNIVVPAQPARRWTVLVQRRDGRCIAQATLEEGPEGNLRFRTTVASRQMEGEYTERLRQQLVTGLLEIGYRASLGNAQPELPDEELPGTGHPPHSEQSFSVLWQQADGDGLRSFERLVETLVEAEHPVRRIVLGQPYSGSSDTLASLPESSAWSLQAVIAWLALAARPMLEEIVVQVPPHPYAPAEDAPPEAGDLELIRRAIPTLQNIVFRSVGDP